MSTSSVITTRANPPPCNDTADALASSSAICRKSTGPSSPTVYVASSHRADLVAAWDVVRRHFGDHDAPSTLLGVAVLGYPHQLVEVEAVAVLPA